MITDGMITSGITEVQFVKLHDDAIEPRNAYGNDAGWDLFALEPTWVYPGVPTDIKTGIAVAIPDGYYGRITHRSSAPRKKGLVVLDGTIDAGFRGELFSCAYTWLRMPGSSALPNTSGHPDSVFVDKGESIAQLIIQPVPRVHLVQVDELPRSERGQKGFGSSGN